MTTQFPSALDNFTNPTPADDLNTPAVLHTDQHANTNDAIEALEAWVGVSGSASTPSHEYRLKILEAIPPGAAQFGFVGQDEGVPLGTGVTLNVVGNDIVLSRSGTVLQLLHTNPPITYPQEVIGIYGQNQGLPLGTGSILNVNGSRLTLSISGTSLELTNSPDPQELIGMMGSGLGTGTILSVSGGRLSMTLTGSSLNIISSPEPADNIGIFALDDGAAVGTGSTVNFGSNLTVVRTGTVLFVDASASQGGGGGIGVVGWNKGQLLGTGTVINVTEPDLTLSISGTVLDLSRTTGTTTYFAVDGSRLFTYSASGTYLILSNSPDPQELIGVYGLSNGSPLGTGTWLDFGDNLTSSLSGTTLRVNVQNTVFPQDNIGIMGQSKGVNIGTGTVLNVNGTRLTLTQSGTVLELSNSPEPVDNIGMFGSGLGTGTILSVSGGRLSMTLTGSSLNIISSPDPAELIGVMGWDEGLPQGTGTVFNVTGQRAVLSRSGTVLELNISPDPVELIGVLGMNKSSSVGTGTTLNVSGTRINLSRNGDVLELTNSPDPIELIGIYGLGNGVPLGTGTWLDFGNNLTATLSGTTLRVDASAGGGGGSMGIVGRDEGVFVGTGTVLDVVGSRATLSFSSPVLTLNISPEPMDNIGVFGRNNGTNLGTGTTIDFGQGLNAAITGTTLFVHPFNGALTGQAWVANTGSANGMAWTDQDYNIQFHLGDGTNVISTGSISAGYAFVDVPVDSVIESWSVVADATGSIVSNIFKSTFAGFPPSTPLAGLGQPLMTNLRTNTGNATGTASVLKTDQLMISVSSVSTLKLATISLRAKKVATS